MLSNGQEEWGSIQGRVIQKTQKMIYDTSLHHKIPIKGKIKQPGERCGVLS